MINKSSKTAFQIILGSAMFAAIAITGCNSDSSTTKDAKTDTTATEKMKSETPPPAATPDTTQKMDTAATRPIKTPN